MQINKILIGLILCFIMVNPQVMQIKAELNTYLRQDTFETDLNDWAILDADTLARNDTISHGGAWSAYADAEEYAAGSWRVYVWTDYASCSENTPYYASVWVYKVVAVNVMAHITINFWNDTHWVGDSNSAEYLANTGWFEMTVSTTSPATTTRYRVIVYVHDSTKDFTINFDDVQFADEPIPEFMAPSLLIYMSFLAILPIVMSYKRKSRK